MHMIRRLSAAVVISHQLFAGSALGQDEQLHAKVAETQARYVEAWVAGDAEALASLFTEDAVFWPISGGSFEGRDAIRQTLQQDPQPEAASIRSTHTERLGDLVFDVGTFTVTLSGAEGGEMEGEYVVVAEETEDGMQIRRLISFEPRRHEAPQ